MAQSVLDGHCKYLPNLLAPGLDFSLCQRLARDLEALGSGSSVLGGCGEEGPEGGGMVEWSRHLKHENPSWSPAFNEVAATAGAP